MVQFGTDGPVGVIVVEASDKYVAPSSPVLYIWQDEEVIPYGGGWESYQDNSSMAYDNNGNLVFKTLSGSESESGGEDEVPIYRIYGKDEGKNLWFSIRSGSIDSSEYLIEEKIYSLTEQTDSNGYFVSKEEYFRRKNELDALDFKPLVTCQNWDTHSYTVHVNSKQSVEDTLAELDRLMQKPLE